MVSHEFLYSLQIAFESDIVDRGTTFDNNNGGRRGKVSMQWEDSQSFVDFHPDTCNNYITN